MKHAFLAFLAKDMERRPECLAPLSISSIAYAAELTDGIIVCNDETFPNDVTI